MAVRVCPPFFAPPLPVGSLCARLGRPSPEQVNIITPTTLTCTSMAVSLPNAARHALSSGPIRAKGRSSSSPRGPVVVVGGVSSMRTPGEEEEEKEEEEEEEDTPPEWASPRVSAESGLVIALCVCCGQGQ